MRNWNLARRVARDGEEFSVRSSSGDWLIAWDAPAVAPLGTPHGANVFCVTADAGVVLISNDGERWDAWRPACPGPVHLARRGRVAARAPRFAAAASLLERGADLNWVGHDGLTLPDVARHAESTSVVEWLLARGAVSAKQPRRLAFRCDLRRNRLTTRRPAS